MRLRSRTLPTSVLGSYSTVLIAHLWSNLNSVELDVEYIFWIHLYGTNFNSMLEEIIRWSEGYSLVSYPQLSLYIAMLGVRKQIIRAWFLHVYQW